ncbi:uncharacterized protein LY79DRAFT_583831 [Colletotrichum navitas]|uniref:Uncharacterized protein n=1 Tax=Colletotrichum navitas TaxID=681940 RepID=A0AAD8UZ24_9PEZI|nr:uncharacterized protein LY79DRAFT_583831 [Colletotrichum navitas]KAK1573192.1 hypothetical protein LY79DRAFT_583831 [Colletotrichum navitas]
MALVSGSSYGSGRVATASFVPISFGLSGSECAARSIFWGLNIQGDVMGYIDWDDLGQSQADPRLSVQVNPTGDMFLGILLVTLVAQGLVRTRVLSEIFVFGSTNGKGYGKKSIVISPSD